MPRNDRRLDVARSWHLARAQYAALQTELAEVKRERAIARPRAAERDPNASAPQDLARARRLFFGACGRSCGRAASRRVSLSSVKSETALSSRLTLELEVLQTLHLLALQPA